MANKWRNSGNSDRLYFIIVFNVIFIFLIYFNWRLITLQYCCDFCHPLRWISHGCTCVPHPEPPSHLPLHPVPLSHPTAPALSTLSHASNLDWWSVSHIIYMFQCYSLRSSHPHLLPQSPKDCSLCLCLHCCSEKFHQYHPSRSHIYVLIYDIFLFLTYLILYNRLQFHPPH